MAIEIRNIFLIRYETGLRTEKETNFSTGIPLKTCNLVMKRFVYKG